MAMGVGNNEIEIYELTPGRRFAFRTSRIEKENNNAERWTGITNARLFTNGNCPPEWVNNIQLTPEGHVKENPKARVSHRETTQPFQVWNAPPLQIGVPPMERGDKAGPASLEWAKSWPWCQTWLIKVKWVRRDLRYYGRSCRNWKAFEWPSWPQHLPYHLVTKSGSGY